jgi:hypothetical protein
MYTVFLYFPCHFHGLFYVQYIALIKLIFLVTTRYMIRSHEYEIVVNQAQDLVYSQDPAAAAKLQAEKLERKKLEKQE